jgi:hypothetical protein
MAKSHRWELNCHDSGFRLQEWGRPAHPAHPSNTVTGTAVKDKNQHRKEFVAAMRGYVQVGPDDHSTSRLGSPMTHPDLLVT